MLSSRINESEPAYLLKRFPNGEFLAPALTDIGEQYDTFGVPHPERDPSGYGYALVITLQPEGVWTLDDGAGAVLREGAAGVNRVE
jgi:hypothetical protein